ncbi:MAG: histidinol-phosphate transaminase [Deltaproteobacteria bacterium RIFCSPLOWO2_02_FULL_50_16]|nr:MAG: histidinol-phosphate transaminase [Deltaproteobacteria bacterium RIFCSPHIGHO2_02_FULL_50_15]OGQ56788.1 MAG: histidinol-phosphate transaminase [Deltaproteobacteria bacterium RIFCSPLOWO2_02_FULL_50_16]OGQ67312.1 MAG: histidinol-phosphate transaminase [Deltaproteobacteria bacterium RIFCSPLOWO2_12_FULL_50_11]
MDSWIVVKSEERKIIDFFGDFLKHGVLMKSLFRKEVLQMKAYHLERPLCDVKLNQNELPRDIPSAIKSQVLVRFVQTPWNRYSKPYSEDLCERVAAAVGWKSEGVTMANGSNVLIQALILSAAVRQVVMTVAPTFSLYRLEAQALGNRVVEVPLLKDFSLPKDDFLRTMRIKKPSIIFLSNPNAPTGNLFPEEILIEIIEKAPGLVVVDEAYYPFSGKTLLPALQQYKNLVLLRTFSKAFALAGVRAGYLLAHPSVVKEVRKVLLPYCLNVLSQIVVETLLEQVVLVQKWVMESLGERERLFEGLQCVPDVSPFPSAANFICFRVKGAKKTFKGLLEQGVLVRDVSDNKLLKNCLRVSVGTAEENARFLQALKFLSRPPL